MSDSYYVSTYSGTGSAVSADGLSGVSAGFNTPNAITSDNSGNVYVGDYTSKLIRKINTYGSVSTIAGYYSGDIVITSGTGTSANVGLINSMIYDGSNNAIYFSTDYGGIGKLNLSNTYVSLIYYTNDQCLTGLVLTSDKNTLFYSEVVTGNIIYSINLTTLAVTTFFTGNLTLGSPAQLAISSSDLYCISSSGEGLFKFKDFYTVTGSSSLTKVINGSDTIVDGNDLSHSGNATVGGSRYQRMVADSNNPKNIYLLETSDISNTINNIVRWYDVNSGQIITITGVSGQYGYGYTDGLGSVARFNMPHGIAMDHTSSYLYVADTSNNVIRKITIPLVCYLDGTKILCLVDGEEIYIDIESLKEGDLVKTYGMGYALEGDQFVKSEVNGFRPIKYVGSRKMMNDPFVNNPDKLYVMKKEKNGDLIEDLVVTGRHPILVSSLPEDHPQRTKTSGMWRHCAYLHPDFEVLHEYGEYRIWHFVLAGEDANRGYGIYANGILTESMDEECCLKNYNLI